MTKVLAAAVIQDKKILLVRKQDKWILPGGKPEQGEFDLACLARGFREDLSGAKLVIGNDKPYMRSGMAMNKGDVVDLVVYLAQLKDDGVKPSGEISDLAWVNDTNAYKLSASASIAIGSLRKDGYM